MIALVLDDTPAPARLVRHATAAHRLRFHVPGLRHDARRARVFEEQLGRWPGVLEVRASDASGRLLVRYAPGAPVLSRLTRFEDAFPAPRRAAGSGAEQVQADWHTLSVEEVMQRLATPSRGLDGAEVQLRLRRFGSNVPLEHPPRSLLQVAAGQLTSVPSLLLIGSAAVSALMGDLADAGVIAVVVVLDAGIGTAIELQSERLIASWERLDAGITHVLRDGHIRRVPTADLVPGDVLFMREGDLVPADGRVVDAHRLAVNEAPLTGESEPRSKTTGAGAPGTPLAERDGMVFAGTSVASGHGRAVVTATGRFTELAHVRRLVEEAHAPPAPLVQRLEQLGNRLALLSVGAAGVTALAGLAHRQPMAGVLRTAVALGVAAIPEGLPLVTTAALARSMKRMNERGLVVRRLAAAEALGSVTVICADKTGTLTENSMRLEVIDLGDRRIDPATVRISGDPLADPTSRLLTAAVLNSDVDSFVNGMGLHVSGSATEQALVRAAYHAGLDRDALYHAYPRRTLAQREDGRPYVVSVHTAPGGGRICFVKGGPGAVLDLCDVEPEERVRLLARNDELAAEGLRVLGVGWRAGEEPWRFLGFVGLRDPVRPGAREVVAAAARAGIRTLVLTGDQRSTAAAIAREVGIVGDVLDGETAVALARDPRSEAGERLARAGVLSRVTPADKLAIVEALRARGEVVAMVGDGINDAPALKAADVGVAVGLRASDAARQVSDVVLASEDLTALVDAIREGRAVERGIRRAARYLFATNLSEVGVVLGAALLGLPAPLTAMQLLWINLVTDSLPALGLALDGGDDVGLPPVAHGTSALFTRADVRTIVRDGMLMTAGGGAVALAGGPGSTFATLLATQLGYALLCRESGTSGVIVRRQPISKGAMS